MSNVLSGGKKKLLTEEETKVGERMARIVNVEGCPYYSGGQLERFRMQIWLLVSTYDIVLG